MTVEIAADVSLARAEADSGEGPYAEVMSTYVELGELLDSAAQHHELISEAYDLIGRLMEIDGALVSASDQRWAVWMTRNTTAGGDVEQ